MPTDANDLLLFAQVIDCGSFSRAAERSGLPKSTVSRRIAALETRLGALLLTRTTRRLQLTEFGELLLEHARRIGEEVEAADALAEQCQVEPAGRLRVTMTPDFAERLLGPMLAAFSARYPRVQLELDLTPRVVDLIGEQVDVGVRLGSLGDDSGLVARRLCLLSTRLYASPAYLAEHGEPQTPAELGTHRAVHLAGRLGDPQPWRLQYGTQRWEGLPAGRIRANSMAMLTELALADAGIAALSDAYLQQQVAAGQLRRVLPQWALPAEAVWAVMPGRRLVPAKTRAFLSALEAALAQRLAPTP